MITTSDVLSSARIRYGIAVLGSGLALGARVAMSGLVGPSRPLATFFLATAITSLVAGFGPGLLSLVLGSGLAAYFLIDPIYSFLAKDPQEVNGLIVFWAIGLVVAGVGEVMRRVSLQALKGQDDLRTEMAHRQRVEADLLAHESRFRTLIDHSSDVITMLAEDGRILYISPSIHRVLGYTAEELMGESGFREIHPEDLESATRALQTAIGSPGVPVTFGFRLRHKDSSWRKVDNVGTSFLHDPSIAAVVVNTRDVTERLAMEDQIRHAEARFRAFMDNSPTIKYLKDEDGCYVWGNFAWARQFGRPVNALLGRDDRVLWPESVAREFQKSDRLALETNATVEVVETIEDRHFMSLKFPIEHEGRRFLGGITLDVTARVAAEEASKRSEAMLLALADSMPAIVWAARPDGSLDYCNRRWFEYTGLSAEQTYTIDGWKAILHPDDVEHCREVWYASVQSGEPYEIEYRFKDHKNGGYRWHLGRALPVRDDSGTIVRWYGTCTDIDDQKHAIEAAERANQAKNRFLAVLSHELRTPLTPVLLKVSAMLDQPTIAPEIRPTLELVRHNVTLESRLIDDLLDVTQISRGRVPLHLESTDVHEAIARAVEIGEADLVAAGLSLVLELEAENAMVEADPPRLQQVIWNLLKNAVKFTPAGGQVTIRTRLTKDEAGSMLVVEVADTGIGIDPDFLPRMFKEFEQAELSPWMRRYGGLGLGLAIGRSVVEGHGGTLTAHSDGEGQGATLRVTLPLSAKPTTDAILPRPAPLAAMPVARLRILLIEDDPGTLSALSSLLRRDRHVVTTADCVAAAMAATDDRAVETFDLIISDIGLPDGNGVDLMRDLQSRRAVPAIALTGYGEDEDIRKSHAAGFRAHLTKPIDFRVLEATIKSVLGMAS